MISDWVTVVHFRFINEMIRTLNKKMSKSPKHAGRLAGRLSSFQYATQAVNRQPGFRLKTRKAGHLISLNIHTTSK